MRHRLAFLLAAVCLVVASAVVGGTPALAGAQDAPPSTGMPTRDIIPKANSGHEPTEAGDRGGALQLLLPVVIVAAMAGAVAHLTRQSRRARTGTSAERLG